MIDPVNIFCAWGCVKWAKNNSRSWSTSVPHPPAWLESSVLVFVFYNQSPENNISKCFIVGKTRSFWCIMHFLWTFVIWILVKCEKVLEGWLLVSATGFSCGFCRGWTIHHKMEFVVMQDVLLKTDPTKGSFLKLRPWLHQPYKSMTVWHIMSSGSEEKASGQAALQVQKRVAADLRFFYLNRPSFLAVGQI